jgi:hypothetical protein
MDPVMINKELARKIPCELMKYDWNIKYNGDFCLNPAKCIPEALQHQLKDHDLCFNFSKGKRILVYVRKDAKPDTSMMTEHNISKNIPVPVNIPPKLPKSPKPPKSPKKCPEGKILNPKTGRCILIKKNKTTFKNLPKLPKSPKKCPEGKVLNPKTGRCILIKNIKSTFKNLPNLPKSPKKCPDGKVLNPKTGRCILVRNKK